MLWTCRSGGPSRTSQDFHESAKQSESDDEEFERQVEGRYRLVLLLASTVNTDTVDNVCENVDEVNSR